MTAFAKYQCRLFKIRRRTRHSDVEGKDEKAKGYFCFGKAVECACKTFKVVFIARSSNNSEVVG